MLCTKIAPFFNDQPSGATGVTVFVILLVALRIFYVLTEPEHRITLSLRKKKVGWAVVVLAIYLLLVYV